jgi:UDP-N-acetylglucosamine--N-acetylmuramyl-(pentapeptide) pyrophosphoryl-undecaprenol N-acetylglucosamine transferase
MKDDQLEIKKAQGSQTIFYVGGGSGGHVAPLLAIHQQILKLNKGGELNFYLVTDNRFYQPASMLFQANPEVKIKKITAGKLRRHPNLKLSRKIMLVGYYFKNVIDIFKLIIGFFQSIILVIKLKPSLVISKGGYVAVPLVLASKPFGVKIVIHDSDTRPGVASKITARYAEKIFTGFETNYYSKNRAEWVGIPIIERDFSTEEIDKFRAGQHLNAKLKTVLILGGGNGSEALNEIIESNLLNLLSNYNVIHQAGEGKQIDFDASGLNGKYIQFGFCPQADIFKYLKLSDVVISRAGATSIQELAYNKKPSIIIPSPYLSDQIKNVKFIEKAGAALSLDQLELEKKPELLASEIEKALEQSAELSVNIGKIYVADSAKKIASEALALL